tara:strand:- start:113 stop:373 length:261 start_codon:yes stop_codon:yes gene_type:complete
MKALFQAVILKGKSRHGKNRIQQHGDQWFVQEVGKFNGEDAMMLRSQDRTFPIRSRGNPNEEWKTVHIHDERWVLLKNDPNFLYFW